MVQVGKCHAKDTESCASAVHGREADARRALGTERESGRVQEEPGTGGYNETNVSSKLKSRENLAHRWVECI